MLWSKSLCYGCGEGGGGVGGREVREGYGERENEGYFIEDKIYIHRL